MQPRASERSYTSWDRARLSVVVPIGVIVAVAIVCIVVAVISSAQRADEVAVQHEKLLFSRALTSYGKRVMRGVKSVAASKRAIENIRVKWNAEWVETRVGPWLKTFFDHDGVFVFDGADKPLYSQFDRRLDSSWMAMAMPDMKAVLDYLRGRNPDLHGMIRLTEANTPGKARTRKPRSSATSPAGPQSSPRSRSGRSSFPPPRRSSFR